MDVFVLIISHGLAFVFGWYCNTKAFEYISAKVDFEGAAKRLMETDEDSDDE